MLFAYLFFLLFLCGCFRFCVPFTDTTEAFCVSGSSEDPRCCVQVVHSALAAELTAMKQSLGGQQDKGASFTNTPYPTNHFKQQNLSDGDIFFCLAHGMFLAFYVLFCFCFPSRPPKMSSPFGPCLRSPVSPNRLRTPKRLCTVRPTLRPRTWCSVRGFRCLKGDPVAGRMRRVGCDAGRERIRFGLWRVVNGHRMAK